LGGYHDNNGWLYLSTFEYTKKQGFPKSPYHIEGRCVFWQFLYTCLKEKKVYNGDGKNTSNLLTVLD